MPPRKRKVAAETTAAAEQTSVVDEKILTIINERLNVIDKAVEERCAAIMQAAEEAASKLMHELKAKLLGMPKKVRNMSYKEYMEANAQPSVDVEAAVDSKLQQLQQQSEVAATVAPTTRSTRSRSRAGANAEPATVRVTRARQQVPKFTTAGPAAQQTAATDTAEPADAAATDKAGPAKAFNPYDFIPEEAETAAAVTPPPAAAASKPASGRSAVGGEADPDAKRAAAVNRAQAKVDAKLAAIGVAASTAVRAGGRTAARAAQPGEQAYSQNGSPLSLHPNITRGRGRAAAGWALMTPAMQQAAQTAAGPNSSMLGCFTLVKKQTGATGAAAATGRAGRSRAATAARNADKTAAGDAADNTAMVIMTEDGSSFAVDSTAGGLSAVPASHRAEVAAKLRAIQELAAKALGAA